MQQTLLTEIPPTYATWDPAFLGAHMVLSGGNLKASGGSTGTFQEMTRSTISKTSGKWYWEITLNTDGGYSFGMGICNSSEVTSNYTGGSANSWAYDCSAGVANKVHTGTAVAYGTLFVQGDVIGVALDMTGGTLIYYRNGVSQGTAYSSGITGTMYAAVTPWNTSLCTANFGASPFVYTVPSGYNAGLFK